MFLNKNAIIPYYFRFKYKIYIYRLQEQKSQEICSCREGVERLLVAKLLSYFLT